MFVVVPLPMVLLIFAKQEVEKVMNEVSLVVTLEIGLLRSLNLGSVAEILTVQSVCQ